LNELLGAQLCEPALNGLDVKVWRENRPRYGSHIAIPVVVGEEAERKANAGNGDDLPSDPVAPEMLRMANAAASQTLVPIRIMRKERTAGGLFVV